MDDHETQAGFDSIAHDAPGQRPNIVIGERLGSYLLEAPLGRGQYGQVFRAIHETLRRPAAVKVIHEHLARDAKQVERFIREARLVASLQDPNVVQVYDAGVVGQRIYMALEFMGAGDCAELLKQRGPLPPTEAVKLITDGCRGLEAIERLGLVHRDIKLANLLLDERGAAKLGDFGLSRLHDGSALAEELSTSVGLGDVVGTPAFMSPEQTNGSSTIDIRSDVYSLGVCLYMLLTGEYPYPFESTMQLVYMICFETPADPRRFVANLPPKLIAVLQRAMAKRTEERYQGPRAFREALEASLANDANPVSTATRMMAAVTSERRQPVVVVIESDPEYRGILRVLLNTLGYAVTLAETGVDGIDAVVAVQPDAVVSALTLDDLPADEIQRRLRDPAIGWAGSFLVLVGRDQATDDPSLLAIPNDDQLQRHGPMTAIADRLAATLTTAGTPLPTGPDRQRPTGLHGDLAVLGLASFLTALAVEHVRGTITVQGPSSARVTLAIAYGCLLGSDHDWDRIISELAQALTWTTGRVQFQPGDDTGDKAKPVPEAIRQALRMTSARHAT